MDLSSALGNLLFFLRLCGICTGFVLENCIDYKLQFERVFSVPGDMAMLNSTLVSPNVFNFRTVPYNITWYVSKTGQKMSNQSRRILIHEETLWFLNVKLEDDGEYVSILRTPSKCYRQATKLVVDLPDLTDQCGKPRTSHQKLISGVNDILQCPLKDYIDKLNDYKITISLMWYRGCDPIGDGQAGRYTYRDTKLMISMVEAQDNGPYTCTLKFTLGGIRGSVSETVHALITENYSLFPQVHNLANEVIKAQMGSNFSKQCKAFVPGIGIPFVYVAWFAGDNLISENQPTEGVYVSEMRRTDQDGPIKGVWVERLLVFSELTEKDFHVNYTCQAYGPRGRAEGYFTLLPTDPNIMLFIGPVLGGATVLFVISVIIYYIFKVDLVLWLRAFPVLCTNKDLDGRLYDAYVAYPQPGAVGFSKEMETFALHTLPQVLENACGYKLFIAGRDCLPGHAITDSVEENIQVSRCLLLLYSASTFTSNQHTSSTSSNNNNISNSGNGSCTSFDGSDEIYPDTRQQLECVLAMDRALLEGSLKVILVELEEITPAQMALFPESVRHLRKKQGAVCWWKNMRTRKRWRTCMSSREDEEEGGQNTQFSPSLSPSARFWKELRYHMPVRGKRVVYPEETALLNL